MPHQLEETKAAKPDPSTQGRRNRAKGAQCERAVANWLRPWFPDARRAIVNGWTSGDRHLADPLDIDGIGPGLCVSVKDTQREYVTAWMADLDAKRAGRLGLLVVRRKGHASPGQWWCWLRLADLLHLCGGAGGLDADAERDACPVRLELRHVVLLLVAANYARAAAVTA